MVDSHLYSETCKTNLEYQKSGKKRASYITEKNIERKEDHKNRTAEV